MEKDTCKEYCIYRHISPSGRVYIGQTKKVPSERWANGNGYKGSPKFYNSILKYGWDNFKHEILFTGLNKISANTIEIDLIFYYKKLGLSLNTANGGEGTSMIHTEEAKRKMSLAKKGKYTGKNSPSYGRHHSEEAKAKMSAAKLGRKLSEETRRKVSLNNAKVWLGKKFSQELRKKLSESHKGIKQSEETKKKRSLSMKGKNAKPVIVYTLEGVFVERFPSAVECAKFFNSKPVTITAAIKHNRKFKYKYRINYDTIKSN